MHSPVRFCWPHLAALALAALVGGGCSPDVNQSPAFKDLKMRVAQMDEENKSLAREVASVRAEMTKLNQDFQPVSQDVAQLIAKGPTGTSDAYKALEQRLARLESGPAATAKGGKTLPVVKSTESKAADAKASEAKTADAKAAETKDDANSTDVVDPESEPEAKAADSDAGAVGATSAKSVAKTGKKARLTARVKGKAASEATEAAEAAATDETTPEPESALPTDTAVDESSAEPATKSAKVAATKPLTATGRRTRGSRAALRRTASASDDQPAHAAGVYHEVKKGETLEAIAKQYQTTTEAILTANGLPKTAKLYVGLQLFIPSK